MTSPAPAPAPAPAESRTLAIGFGTTTAMWAVAYISMLKPGLVLGEVLFALLLGCLLAGGVIAGRASGAIAGAKIGAIAAGLNLLIVGSLLIDPQTRQPHPDAWWWIVGDFAISIALAAIGGVIGARFFQSGATARPAALSRRAVPSDAQPDQLNNRTPCRPRADGQDVAPQSDVPSDTRCTACSYLLRELQPTSNCPECGKPIAESLAELQSGPAQSAIWFAKFLIIAAATVFLLLITGGLVTGLEAGLAVPDWPRSFGHNMLLYPLAEMREGVYFEHAHRLYGMLVGVTAITVAAGMFFFDSRRAMRTLGVVFLLMVIIQGIMGGTRVTETSLSLAIIHGIFGQIVFATIVLLAAFASPTWRSPASGMTPQNFPRARADRGMAIGLVAMLLVQLALGALYRHLQGAPGVNQTLATGMLHGHITIAVLIAVKIPIVAIRAWGTYGSLPVLPSLGKSLLILLAVQIALGIAALLAVLARKDAPNPGTAEIILTTAHQATGALLFATAALYAAWTQRLLRLSPLP